MKIIASTKYLSICLWAALLVQVRAQGDTNSSASPDWSKMNAKQRYQSLIFSTSAYRKEALRLMIKEANRVAQELKLPENLPIVESNLISVYISPPRMAQASKAIGNITTSNYIYYISVGSKFSYLVQRNLQAEYTQLESQYLWPTNRMNTNGAYQLATQFLESASMDVRALNNDCNVHIDAFRPEGESRSYFVPEYWVYWMPKGRQIFGPAAEVELFMPTRTIQQLRVNKSEYILRKPLVITNLDYLLSQTNAIAGTNAPTNQ